MNVYLVLIDLELLDYGYSRVLLIGRLPTSCVMRLDVIYA